MPILETSVYLKPEHVKTGDILEVIEEGEIRRREETGFENDVFSIPVKAKTGEYIWNMNKTTQRNLISEWGNNTGEWIGKRIKITVTRQQVLGKMRDVIYGVSAETE